MVVVWSGAVLIAAGPEVSGGDGEWPHDATPTKATATKATVATKTVPVTRARAARDPDTVTSPTVANPARAVANSHELRVHSASPRLLAVRW